VKRVGYLYPAICDIENIKKAIMKSSLGKRHQRRVKDIIENIDYYSAQIQRMLLEKTYIPSPYIVITLRDGATQKVRTIHKPKYYPDQIIHWALMLQLEPIIMRGMYQHNCGSVPGRGTSYGQKILRRWLDNDRRGTKYCLKLDIKKFYPSVNNDILMQMFQRKIKDIDTLRLINAIIDSEQGLPIGNYTSQWFSNFYLQTLDHWIKEYMGIKYYVRYVDDLVLLGGNKKHLHKVKRAMDEYLKIIDLKIKDNWQVFRVDKRPIDFLGFKFYRNKTLLRKQNALRIKRRMKKIRKKKYLNYLDACAIISYWGWIKRSDSYNLYLQNFVGQASVNLARKVVSAHGKIRLFNQGRRAKVRQDGHIRYLQERSGGA
jgi:RNA-directed DNA polymerase